MAGTVSTSYLFSIDFHSFLRMMTIAQQNSRKSISKSQLPKEMYTICQNLSPEDYRTNKIPPPAENITLKNLHVSTSYH